MIARSQLLCAKWFANASVEPALALFCVAWSAVELTSANLLLQKECSRANAASTQSAAHSLCADLSGGVSFVAKVNDVVSSVKVLLEFASVALLTSWSERAGRKRKPFILLPILGLMLASVSGLFHVYFWSWPPMWAAVMNATLDVVVGNVVTMHTFAFLYICDVSDEHGRTARLAFASALSTLGQLAGVWISGHLLRAVGFANLYVLCLVVGSLSFGCAYRCVVDMSVYAPATSVRWRSVFDVRRIFESIRVVFGRREPMQMVAVLLLLLNFALLFFSREGLADVMYLFLIYRFAWNEKDYSSFLIIKDVVTFVSTVTISLLLRRTLKIHDCILAIFASFWSAMVVLSYSFAKESSAIYIIGVADFCFGISLTACQSYLSKFFNYNELGHLFSVKQLFCLLVALCHPLFNETFRRTKDTLPETIFFMDSAFYLLITVLNCLVYRIGKVVRAETASWIPLECRAIGLDA